ncbi:class I SAM-dependent methyltransferase [Kordiimonas lacus]|uniref:Methyltransferase domain-containing protein n=1 Tax=Kordiimonas lacus TaxID=637679 RepID=A0A1G6URB3_9PROT|nr:class I SAM-dependent methyltransferase [Kordiimonas lacus]SDD43803.1 Methyltransferase domain-containing protein [Kordiimonas lacus]
MVAKETAWTTYWHAANRLDSCIVRPGQQEGDQKAIFGFWREFVKGCPSGGRLLDLATGNGAVALRLVQAAADLGKDVTVNAVDLADIRPESYLTEYSDFANLIAFRGGVDICALPFGDQCFDGAVSQFGFEYAPATSAVAELARVLRSGAPFQLLVHHKEGALVAPNVAQIAEIETLLGSGGLVDCIQQLLAGTSSMDALEGEGRRLLSENNNQLPRITAEIFAAVRQLLTRQDLDLAIRIQGAADMRHRLEAEQERMRQLGHAALSGDEADSLCRLMTDTGLHDVAVQPFHVGSDQALLGWQVTGRR